MEYCFSRIEQKWQRYWAQHQTFKVAMNPEGEQRPKYYILDMFPYPSGRACTWAIPKATLPPTSWPAIRECAGTTSSTPWAGTPSDCPQRTTPSKPALHPHAITEKNIADV